MRYSHRTIRARQTSLLLALVLTLSALVAPTNGFDGRTLAVAVAVGYLITTTRTPTKDSR